MDSKTFDFKHWLIIIESSETNVFVTLKRKSDGKQVYIARESNNLMDQSGKVMEI